jgi:FAD/FMN-containing dehydrogenase
VETREYADERVDGLDGVAFAPGEYYLTLARWSDAPGPTSDYTGRQIYYRSIQERETDMLTTYDYLWRWDTDWFWCSGAFGAQHPVLRRLWPRRWRRSDVYMRMLGLDRRFDIADRLDRRAGRPQRERVIQDVEVPVERLPEFLDWFDEEIGMRPVWLCPLVATRDWPTYPLEPHRTYVNVGFWGTVHVGPDAPQAPRNRAIETKVHELDGHKSLYSEAFYDRGTFDRLYDGANLAAVKERYDPDDRLTSLYDKAVRQR